MPSKLDKALATGLLLTLISIGSAADGSGPVVVVASKHRFEPAEITIKPGTTVRWENRERTQYHSVYFEALGGPKNDYFFPGESRERRFDQPGVYPYICEPHLDSHGMRGVVRVDP